MSGQDYGSHHAQLPGCQPVVVMPGATANLHCAKCLLGRGEDPCWAGNGRRSRYRLHEADVPLDPDPSSRFRTKRSTPLSMPMPKANCAVELMPACVMATARASPRSRGTDRRGQIPEMVSIHVRPPESKIAACQDTGKATSSRALATSPPSACWSSAPAAWCCSRGWKTLLPLQRWRGFTVKLNAISRADAPEPDV